MRVILIRHGDAGAYTQPDHERNLSDVGQLQAQQTADWLTQHYQPTQFIVSPYSRARQTLAIIHQHFDDIPMQVCNYITPNDDAKIAIDALSDYINALSQDSCVIIVCHMNIIAYMASILTDTSPEGFGLAEARVYEMPVFAADLAVETNRFLPNI